MDKTTETIALLAKIMDDEGELPNEIQKQYSELYQHINENFEKSLSSSIMTGKALLLKELNSILEKVHTLVTNPNLIGKTVIGVVGSDTSCFEHIISMMLPSTTIKFLAMNKNIPLVCVADINQTFSANNVLENTITLNSVEYNKINKQFYKDDINIRSLISSFCIGTKLTYENFGLIHFPDYCRKNASATIALEEQSDVIFMFYSSEDKKILHHLNHLSSKASTWGKSKRIYVVVKNQQTLLEFQRTVNFHHTFIPITSTEIESIFISINTPRINYSYYDEVKLKLLEIDVFYLRHVNKLKRHLATINKDLVNIGHDQTTEKVKKIRQKLKDNIDSIQQSHTALQSASEKLLNNFSLIEKSLSELDESSNTTIWHNDIDEILSSLAFKLIDVGNFREVREYIKKLQARNFPNSYVFDLLVAEAGNEYRAENLLARLNADDEDLPLIQKSKIALSDSLRLSEEKVSQIASRIKSPSTAKEYHYKALYQEQNSKENDAIELYFKALEMGYLKSGERLFFLSKNNNLIKLERLAQNMVPVANYELAMKIKDKQHAKAITNLKMAASNEYLPAIKELTNDFYGKVISTYYKSLSKDEMKEKYDNVISLCSYILSKEPGNTDAIEKLGNLFYKLEDYRRAMEYFSKINTAYALFKCGNMYQYGKGVSQDLHKAQDYLWRASQNGYSKAKIDYDKVCAWIQNEANKKSSFYNSQHNYSKTSRSYSSGSSSSSSSGWCFITTATCLALQKPDDCHELTLLRKYRDFMRSKNRKMDALVQEYYRIAPIIVRAINQESDSATIYIGLYENYIAKTCDHLKTGDLPNATVTYIDMVRQLCFDYKIEISDEITEIIDLLKTSVNVSCLEWIHHNECEVGSNTLEDLKIHAISNKMSPM